MIDVLFINPGHGENYPQLDNIPAIAPPSWILLMAEYCRRKGNSVALWDVNIGGWSEKTAEKIISDYDPLLIVIWVAGHNPSASTQTMPIADKIAKDIKNENHRKRLAMGGVHPSALPNDTLIDEFIDFVIIGEGFGSVSMMADCLRNSKPWHNIPGIRFLGQSRFVPVPLVNLDNDLPGYAWDLLGGSLDDYRAHEWHLWQDAKGANRRSPYATIYTQLGCPFGCDFCVTPGFFGSGKVRAWSPNTVVGWIDELVDVYHVRNIRIEDEIFLLDDRRTKTICDLLIDRGYDLNLFCYGRVREYPKRLLQKMKAAGFNWIGLGIESARGKTGHDAMACVRAIQRAGMSVGGNFIFGLPGERQEDMEATLRLALDLRCEMSNFYCCMPLPGSSLYQQAEREGRLPLSWEAYSQLGYECHPMGTEYLSPERVLRFRDCAYKEYHSDLAYLEMIGKKWGWKLANDIDRFGKGLPNRLLRS